MQLLIPLSTGGEPLFRQIYQGVRRAILSGALPKGACIPSTRDLADQLGVSRTIVVLAYDQLTAEGFVAGRSGSGTFVSVDLASRSRPSAEAAKFRLSRFGVTAEQAGPEVDFPGRKTDKSIRYDFAYGRSDIDVFPFEAWRRTLIRNARKAPVRDLDYGPASGSLALREAICVHLRRSRGVVCDHSQVIIVNGSQQGLDLIGRVLIERGDAVAIEDPQYQGTRETLRAAGARLRPIPVDRDGLNPAMLPRSARMVFVTPSHQFPTGGILPLARRLALLQWASGTGAVVVEDDYDGEFRYDGQVLESLQGLDGEGRVIYMGTFSRTVFSALRIGYLIVPKPLVRAFAAAKWLSDRHTATLEQQTLADFIAGGMYERHLRNIRRRNTTRRKVLLDAIHNHLSDRVEVTGDGAGAHVVLWPRWRCSEEAIVSKAASAGVRVYGISRYFLRTPSPAGLLLGYARLEEHAIKEGVRRLAAIFPSAPRGQLRVGT
jgi:GntR family transcriptional regulator / MocR family aminotransferase